MPSIKQILTIAVVSAVTMTALQRYAASKS